MPQMPPLSDAELKELLDQPLVSKFATQSPEGEIRITPLWFGPQDDGSLLMNTWDSTEAVRNLQNNSTCSMLIDTNDFPYRGVHFWGQAEVEGPENDVEAMAKLFAPYRGDLDTAREYSKQLIGYGIGKRLFIRFRPERNAGWDFRQ